MQRRRREYPVYPTLAIPIVLAGLVLYLLGCTFFAISWPVAVTSEHRALDVSVSTTGVRVWVGWGRPSRYWLTERRDDGELHSVSGFDQTEFGHELFGFQLGYRSSSYYESRKRHEARWIALGVPWWFGGALVAAPWLQQWEHRRRVGRRRRERLRAGRNMGHCGGCGYDLRASVLRCPECGRRIG